MATTDTIHGSVVAIGGAGVLVRGASGAGKSTLVLSILHAEGARAELVADDRVCLETRGDIVVASAPAKLAGLIEVRGQGILQVPYLASVALRLVVDLAPEADCPRFPEGDERSVAIHGVHLPRIFLATGAPGGPARVAFALAAQDDGGDSHDVPSDVLIRPADQP